MINESVRRVQQALLEVKAVTGDERHTYDLGPRGADADYGPQTEAAVKKFKTDFDLGSTQFGDVGPGTMDKLDKLFSAVPKPPIPPGPIPIPPSPQPQVNPELEDTLDAVWVEYQLMFQAQNNALNRLEKDLTKQEAPGNALKEFLAIAAVETLAALFSLGGVGFGGLIIGSLGVGKKTADHIEEWAVEPVVKEGVVGSTKDLIGDSVKEHIQDRSSEEEQLRAFIEAQQEGLINQTAEVQKKFLTEGKPKAREPVPLDKLSVEDFAEFAGAVAAGADLRLLLARKLLKAQEAERKNAANNHYTEAAVRWAQYIAKKALNPEAGEEEQKKATDLKKATKLGTRGVLEIEIGGLAPKDPIRILNAKITGLSKATRERLTQHRAATRLGDLGLLRVVHGAVFAGEITPGVAAGTIRIGRNEQSDVVVISANRSGSTWLQARGALNGFSLTPEGGAISVFQNDIDPKTVKDLPGGIQGRE
jgi:hypothetical protein